MKLAGDMSWIMNEHNLPSISSHFSLANYCKETLKHVQLTGQETMSNPC